MTYKLTKFVSNKLDHLGQKTLHGHSMQTANSRVENSAQLKAYL